MGCIRDRTTGRFGIFAAVLGLLAALAGGCAESLGDKPPTEVAVGTPPTWDNGIGELMRVKCAVCHQIPLTQVSSTDTPTYFDLRYWAQSPTGISGALIILPFLDVGILRGNVDDIRQMPLEFATPLVQREIDALMTWSANGGPRTLTVNQVPVADAGIDQNVNTGSTVALDGSGSSDADGEPLT